MFVPSLKSFLSNIREPRNISFKYYIQHQLFGRATWYRQFTFITHAAAVGPWMMIINHNSISTLSKFNWQLKLLGLKNISIRLKYTQCYTMIYNSIFTCFKHTNPIIFLGSLISLRNGSVLGANVWILFFKITKYEF